MPPLSAVNARRTAVVAARPQTNNVILYDGAALNVDHNAYISQHDVVYQTPPIKGSQAMPIGDGDLGAMLWCPDCLHLQIQKSDLWADPSSQTALPSEWQQVSAGTVSIESTPSFLTTPNRFEQRLSLNSGIVTISSDTAQGACQITAFASASSGVLVVNYKDQTVRKVERRIDVKLWREAHLFAMGETIGILHGLKDRRYALLARIAGSNATARKEGNNLSSLHLEPSRSSEFTLYIAVAASPQNGDPVAAAKSRLVAAMNKGYERLVTEQRQHWNMFWQKSFLRLTGVEGDPLPAYLENLWYLSLYQLACCSRGYDAPLSNGGLWLNNQDAREGAALYEGGKLRQMLAALVTSNHLELSVPYVDTFHRLLPEMAARTGSELGMGGARFPARFSHTGLEVPAENRPSHSIAATQTVPKNLSDEALGDGLDSALLIWEAWRHAPDTFFLLERAYPLLRACTTFALEYCQSRPELWNNSQHRSKLLAALRALLWASREYDLDEELRPEWETAWKTHVQKALPHPLNTLNPFRDVAADKMPSVFRDVLKKISQQPAGMFGTNLQSPDLSVSATLCAGLNALVITNQPLLDGEVSSEPERQEGLESFGGAHLEAIRVFPALPETWDAAFTLSAPGGFRISAEAKDGRARYVAIKSLLGGQCRLVNPWGQGERARVMEGRDSIAESAGPILEFMTQQNTSYLVERGNLPLSRAVSVRLGGIRNNAPKYCYGSVLGLGTPQMPDKVVHYAASDRVQPRMEKDLVVVNAGKRFR